jgi:hypothetical protein
MGNKTASSLNAETRHAEINGKRPAAPGSRTEAFPVVSLYSLFVQALNATLDA